MTHPQDGSAGAPNSEAVLTDDELFAAWRSACGGRLITSGDAQSHLAIMRAAIAADRAKRPPSTSAEAVPIVQKELIAACYEQTGFAQGEKGCVAFLRGAQWYQQKVLAAHPAPSTTVAAGEAVATIHRGGTDKFGRATVLQRWEDGADKLPDGEHKLFAAPPTDPKADLLRRMAEMLEALLNKIRRDAPELSGKLMGEAKQLLKEARR